MQLHARVTTPEAKETSAWRNSIRRSSFVLPLADPGITKRKARSTLITHKKHFPAKKLAVNY